MKYEAHITVEPTDEHTFEQFAQDCKEICWNASMFEHDDVDGIAGKWFMSYASDDRSDMVNAVRSTVEALEQSVTVLRWKVEKTLYDSKEGHGLNDLCGSLPRMDSIAKSEKPLGGMPISEVGDIAVEELENLGVVEPCIAMFVVAPQSGEVAVTTNVGIGPDGNPINFPLHVALYVLEQNGLMAVPAALMQPPEEGELQQ